MRNETVTDTPLARALARAVRDEDFRAHVVEDGRAAQVEYALTDDEWHTLVSAVDGLEHEFERDPAVATEVDHGEADAAGVKV